MRRTSSAIAVKYATTCSGVPLNFARSSGRWVAMPVGQLFKWHWRAMAQPIATRAAVPKPYASAPSKAAITTSRPVLSPPSTRTSMRCRSPFSINSACVSASPSSHGEPACLIEDSGEAPVPPLWPETST